MGHCCSDYHIFPPVDLLNSTELCMLKCKYSTKGNYYLSWQCHRSLTVPDMLLCCCLLWMQPLTLMEFMFKCVTTALPRSDGAVSYEDVCVEQTLLCVFFVRLFVCLFAFRHQNIIHNVIWLKSSHRGKETWRASYYSLVNVTLVSKHCSLYYFLLLTLHSVW